MDYQVKNEISAYLFVYVLYSISLEILKSNPV